MAQYKVPQDVEADDKLLGPFSFRQFVYLMVTAGLIALTVGLFQLFPMLAIVPIPFAILFGALALPIRKDQPMETYLVAIVSYYLKPKSQLWKAGQRESTIEITAPKIVEPERTRNITGEEATHRLSFLADIVDTGGRAIKGNDFNHASEELAVEAENTQDMFEMSNFGNLDNAIRRNENERHDAVIQEMKEQIQRDEEIGEGALPMVKPIKVDEAGDKDISKAENNSVIVMPDNMTRRREHDLSGGNERGEGAKEIEMPEAESIEEKVINTEQQRKAQTFSENPSIIELANNNDYSVATIAKEANRIKERMEDEVFVSLH